MSDAEFLVIERIDNGLVIAGGSENDVAGGRFRIRDLRRGGKKWKITGKRVVKWF